MRNCRNKYEKWLAPEGLLLLEGWARAGLDEKQIAKNCGCSQPTLAEWRKKFPPIEKALRRGRDVTNMEVENALLKRALGYEYTETRVETGETERVIRQEKYRPPDVGAAKYWLERRMPEVWGNRPAAPPKDGEPRTGCVILPAAEGTGDA